MTASISPQNPKIAVASQQESSLSKVSNAKAKEVAPGNAPEIINRASLSNIAESPAAVVTLGKSQSSRQDLYQKTGTLEQPAQKTTNQNPSVNTKQPASAEIKAAQEKTTREPTSTLATKNTQDSSTKNTQEIPLRSKADAYTARATAERQLQIAV